MKAGVFPKIVSFGKAKPNRFFGGVSSVDYRLKIVSFQQPKPPFFFQWQTQGQKPETFFPLSGFMAYIWFSFLSIHNFVAKQWLKQSVCPK